MDERDERNEIIQSQLEELKRYKKIGPTPEQLMEIDLMYREKCKEVTRLTEHIHSLGDEIVRLRAAVDRKRWIPCSERYWVEAQMALLDIEMVKMEEIFFPYIVDQHGETLYQKLEQRQFLLEGQASE